MGGAQEKGGFKRGVGFTKFLPPPPPFPPQPQRSEVEPSLRMVCPGRVNCQNCTQNTNGQTASPRVVGVSEQGERRCNDNTFAHELTCACCISLTPFLSPLAREDSLVPWFTALSWLQKYNAMLLVLVFFVFVLSVLPAAQLDKKRNLILGYAQGLTDKEVLPFIVSARMRIPKAVKIVMVDSMRPLYRQQKVEVVPPIAPGKRLPLDTFEEHMRVKWSLPKKYSRTTRWCFVLTYILHLPVPNTPVFPGASHPIPLYSTSLYPPASLCLYPPVHYIRDRCTHSPCTPLHPETHPTICFPLRPISL